MESRCHPGVDDKNTLWMFDHIGQNRHRWSEVIVEKNGKKPTTISGVLILAIDLVAGLHRDVASGHDVDVGSGPL